MNQTREEFQEIVSGWALIDGMEDITDGIERVVKWTEQNGPLLPAEDATVQLTIQGQIARGIDAGDFDGSGISREDLLNSLTPRRDTK